MSEGLKVQGVDVSQIIAIKRYYATNKEAPQRRDSSGGHKSERLNEGNLRQEEARCGTLKRLKVYYARQGLGRQKSARKLTKLKKLIVRESQLPPNSHSTSSSTSCSSNSLANEDTTNGRAETTTSATSDPNGCSNLNGRQDKQRLEGLAGSLEEYARLIEHQLDQQRQLRPRRLLLFVNPIGGKGRALQLFKRRVRPLLELAQVRYELVVTEYANHARDTVQSAQCDLDQVDGIVCIGGDGMFSELMNGLLFRANSQLLAKQNQLSPRGALDEVQSLRLALGGLGQRFESPVVPIGVIGAGSTDANLFGFTGTNDPVTATLNIILGRQLSVDVCSIHSLSDDRLLRFASTFVAYGYFGDVVRESEKLRWLGPSRYDLSGALSLLRCRSYGGLVRIWRSHDDGRPEDQAQRCDMNCSACISEKHTKFQNQTQQAQRRHSADKLELVESLGPFMGVNAAVTACRCPQTRKGFSPGNHLANGCADLILVRSCSRLQYVNYLLRTGFTKKSAFDLDYVDAYRCRQFEFRLDSREGAEGEGGDQRGELTRLQSPQAGQAGRPGTPEVGATRSLSSWNADGEILCEQSIRVKVNRRLLRVFGTGEQRRRQVH